MASRDIQVARTRKKLEDAFNRLKNGEPVNVFGSYRISPSKVEQEAAVSQGTLNNRHYAELKKEIQQYKSAKVAEEKGFAGAEEELRQKLKDLRDELAKSEERRTELAADLKRVEQLFELQAAEHLKVVAALIKALPKENRAEINDLIEGARKDESDNSGKIIKMPKRSSRKNKE